MIIIFELDKNKLSASILKQEDDKMCSCIDKILLFVYSVLKFFGITKKGISTAERLLRILAMIVVIAWFLYLIIEIAGILMALL